MRRSQPSKVRRKTGTPPPGQAAGGETTVQSLARARPRTMHSATRSSIIRAAAEGPGSMSKRRQPPPAIRVAPGRRPVASR